jgi:hypothetical protein
VIGLWVTDTRVIGLGAATAAGAEADATAVAGAVGEEAADATGAAVMAEATAVVAVGTKTSWPRIYTDLC